MLARKLKLKLSLVVNSQQNKPLALNPKIMQGFKSILCDTNLDKEFIAKTLTFPGEGKIMDMMKLLILMLFIPFEPLLERNLPHN